MITSTTARRAQPRLHGRASGEQRRKQSHGKAGDNDQHADERERYSCSTV